jgi:hypothetical protein
VTTEDGVSPWSVRIPAMLNVLLPGVYAWGATVAAPALVSGLWALLAAASALLALLLGVGIHPVAPRLGRGLGILAFTGLSMLTWALARPALALDRLDPIRACLGGFGWTLTAIGWGSLAGPVPSAVAESATAPSADLLPRKRLPLVRNVLVLGVALAGAFAATGTAWTVERQEPSLLAHAAAGLAALGLVTVGGIVVAERRQGRPPLEPRARLRGAAGGLVLLALGLLGGLLWALLA